MHALCLEDWQWGRESGVEKFGVGYVFIYGEPI